MDPKIIYSNSDTDRMFAYHERTKHSYWSVRQGGHTLDWANQPNPFRYYMDAPVIPLPKYPTLPDILTFTALEQVQHDQKPHTAPPISPEVIGQILYYSMAISAWKQVRGTEFRYSLRVNPSSGNLHPTETYLAVERASGLADGLYHYRVQEHALEQRRQGAAMGAIASTVQIPWLAHCPLVILLTSVFWRESWKYRDRAYRYCLLDLGHAALSILCAAKAMGISGTCLGHFPDIPLAELLGIDPLDEGPLMIIPFGPKMRPTDNNSIPRSTLGPLQGEPNRLSSEKVSYDLLLGMHQSTLLPLDPGSCPRIPEETTSRKSGGIPLSRKLPRDLPLRQTARKRRSGLDFDPSASITLGELGVLLAHAASPVPADYHGLEEPSSLIQLYLYAHRVVGLSPGCYRYDSRYHQIELIKKGDQRQTAVYLSLEQELAGNACVAFSMIADLERAARIFGNRGYRYVHFDAGMIGQALYLGSEALGLNATGIGAFYDDEVHRYLGLSSKEGQVIYHFAVGRAVPDERLISVGEETIQP